MEQNGDLVVEHYSYVSIVFFFSKNSGITMQLTEKILRPGKGNYILDTAVQDIQL